MNFSLTTNRRVVMGGLAATAAAPLLAQAPAPPPPPQDLTLVRDWVAKAHQRKLEPMAELLRREPALIHASHDWGGGDWESAMQAAAHTGSREMALFLLEKGARVDLFASAMLGQLALVKSALEVTPGALEVRGAHGIPLLSHAVAGGAESDAVLRLLLDRGANVNAVPRNGMTPLLVAVQTRRREAVRLLLDKGANANAKAGNGATALSLSVTADLQDIAADLRKAGALE